MAKKLSRYKNGSWHQFAAESQVRYGFDLN